MFWRDKLFIVGARGSRPSRRQEEQEFRKGAYLTGMKSLLNAPSVFHHPILMGIGQRAKGDVDCVEGFHPFAKPGAGPTPCVSPEVRGEADVRSATHVLLDLFFGHATGVGFKGDFFGGRTRMERDAR